MFEDLRDAFREAVRNFRDELNRDQVSGNVDRILHGMVEEVTSARARLQAVEADLEKTRKLRAREEEHVATMARRREMAAGIDDGETERLAAEFEARHQERLEVFIAKEEALSREFTLLSREVDEMMVQVKEARARRAGLAAQAGRAGTRETLNETDDLFEAFERMEERIAGAGAEAEAAEAFSREYGADSGPSSDLRIDLDAPPPHQDVDFDAALAELKRRMGKADS